MKVFGIEHELKTGGQNPSYLPIWRTVVNGIYVALDKTTTGYYEVICNSNGTQKSGGGNWSDVPVTQRLSELNGTGRDKWLNKRNWKNFNEAKVEFGKLIDFVKNICK